MTIRPQVILFLMSTWREYHQALVTIRAYHLGKFVISSWPTPDQIGPLRTWQGHAWLQSPHFTRLIVILWTKNYPEPPVEIFLNHSHRLLKILLNCLSTCSSIKWRVTRSIYYDPSQCAFFTRCYMAQLITKLAMIQRNRSRASNRSQKISHNTRHFPHPIPKKT